MTLIVDCPICGKKVEWKTENRYRPFCSERCKQIDLSAWATGQYTITTPDPDEPSDDKDNGNLN